MHLEYSDLVRCSETVLDPTQQAVRMIAFTLKVKDGISDVFEGLWASNGAFFRDVSDDKDGCVGALCQLHELERTFTHLADTTGSGCQVTRKGSLNRLKND